MLKNYLMGRGQWLLSEKIVAVIAVFFALCAQGKNKYTAADSILITTLYAHAYDTQNIDPARAVDLTNDIARRSEASGFSMGLADAYLLRARRCTMLSQYDSAAFFANKALTIAESNQYTEVLIKAHAALGNIYNYSDDYTRSSDEYQKALKLCGPGVDSAVYLPVFIGMAQLSADMRMFEGANTYALIALRIATQSKNWLKVAYLNVLIAENFCNLNDLSSDLPYLKTGQAMIDSLHITGLKGHVSQVVGQHYMKTGRYDSALRYYLMAQDYYEKNGDVFNRSNNLYYIGESYEGAQDLTSAEKYYRQSLEMAEKCASPDLIRLCDLKLADINAALGAYKKAYEFRTAQTAAQDSLFSKDRADALGALKAKFDTRELESKNELLRQQTEVQRLRLRQRDILLWGGAAFALLVLAGGILLVRHNRLKTNQKLLLLEQKQLLAQINPHFIFNCLNAVQQFIVQNDIGNANNYLADFAMLMRQTLDNSREESIPLYREIEYLENYLSLEALRFERAFVYKVTVADDVDTGAAEIPPMIIQPFVENAINHGLLNLEGKQGELEVRFCKKENFLICEVDDNGIGMAGAEKLKSQMVIRHKSQGMEMIRQRLALVSKLSGEDYRVSVVNKTGAGEAPGGTTIILKFPYRHDHSSHHRQ